jgi:hypothetical protein
MPSGFRNEVRHAAATERWTTMSEDQGFLPDGTPWVRWNAPNKAKPIAKKSESPMDEQLSPRAAAKVARAIVEYFGKRKAALRENFMKGIGNNTLDDLFDRNAEAIIKAKQAPVLSSTHYADLQKRVALANAIQIAKIKGKTPHPVLAQSDGDDDDDGDGEPLHKKIARLMKERGWGVDKFDLAASEAMKAEPPQRGPRPVAAGRINTGSREILGDNLD